MATATATATQSMRVLVLWLLCVTQAGTASRQTSASQSPPRVAVKTGRRGVHSGSTVCPAPREQPVGGRGCSFYCCSEHGFS